MLPPATRTTCPERAPEIPCTSIAPVVKLPPAEANRLPPPALTPAAASVLDRATWPMVTLPVPAMPAEAPSPAAAVACPLILPTTTLPLALSVLATIRLPPELPETLMLQRKMADSGLPIPESPPATTTTLPPLPVAFDTSILAPTTLDCE